MAFAFATTFTFTLVFGLWCAGGRDDGDGVGGKTVDGGEDGAFLVVVAGFGGDFAGGGYGFCGFYYADGGEDAGDCEESLGGICCGWSGDYCFCGMEGLCLGWVLSEEYT